MDRVRFHDLSFEPLRREDIPLMYSWLQRPHVRDVSSRAAEIARLVGFREPAF